MSLPVSQYEALLAQVRGLRRQAQHVQQLADPLLFGDTELSHDQDVKSEQFDYTMDTLLLENLNTNTCYDGASSQKTEIETSEDESAGAHSNHHSVSSEPISQNTRGISGLYHGTWPVERTMWNSEPATLVMNQPPPHRQMEMPSVMSFASSSGAPMERVLATPDRSRRSSQQLEAKVDMVYSLLAMLGGQEHADMGETLLALSTNPESCLAMRQSGCIPLLVQLVQSDRDSETRKKASKALYNLVHSQPDEKLRKRETRILKLLETVCAYNEALRSNVDFVCENLPEDGDRHPVQTIAHLMKLSFDEGHRQAICQLGGIHTIAKLVEAEHSIHGSTTDETHCILMRRYACMALTNLTFGDSGNKALLCSYKDFIRALVVQLQSPSDELRQVTASVMRNLSWRADSSSKEILKEVGSVQGLMKSAMLDNKENTLKSILSALWNLSAHCTENKSEICAVKGALAFLVEMLLYKSASKSLAIIENSGGILRNISSQIAVRDDYREILRKHNCLQILLGQLKSPSLTIVSNACGTLWNLSAKNATDQELLWQLGAPTMLRSLNHSKHKMIAMGSSATLKNLLSAKPGQALLPHMDATALSLDLPALPTLGVRKQKALLKDLDQNLSETFDNIDPSPDQKNLKNKQNEREASPNSVKSPIAESSNNTFSSLNINEPSTSFSHDKKSRIPQCSGPSSLPYMNTDFESPFTSTPIKNKYTDKTLDEVQSVQEPTSSSRKHSKNKTKSGISKKSSGKYAKLESFSSHTEIVAEHCKFSLQYTDDDNHSNTFETITKPFGTDPFPEEVSRRERSIADPSNLEPSMNIIDNDKHKNKAKMKEVVTNMDEKDHCSTEDISDSEVQITKEKSKLVTVERRNEVCDEPIEEIRLRNNLCGESHSAFNLSLSVDGMDDASSIISDSSRPTSGIISSCELPNSPTQAAHPSPKPRKSATDIRPQPAPRSLPKSSSVKDNITNFNVGSCIMVPNLSTDNVSHFQLSNIPKQQESVEDNTLQREELSEKQDIGKEKKANISNDNNVGNFQHRENVDELQSKRSELTTNRIEGSTSKLLTKGFAKNSGIPMSRLPSRSSPPKSSLKTEHDSINTNHPALNGCSTSDIVHEEVMKPTCCNGISSALPSTRSQSNVTIDSPQGSSNMRREGMSEANKMPNEDLNRKDDISLREEIETSNYTENKERQVSSSKDSEKIIVQKPQLNLDKDVTELNISEENNAIQFTSISSTSSTNNILFEGCTPKLSTNKVTIESLEASMDNRASREELEIRNKVLTKSSIEENLTADLEKTGSNKSLGKILDMSVEYPYSTSASCLVFNDKNVDRLERGCNDSANVLDTGMLDPDAMIESLDRFTAELVSQASSHLQNKDSLYKSSANDTTWDEHSSPNEVTFPSISVSAPNVVSFKSENENDSIASSKNELDIPDQQEQYSNDFSSFNTSTMTESTLIAMEATKIAAAFKESADMSLSANSLISLELDNVQPPSHLNSLSNSMIGFDSKPNSPKMMRKKSLPSNIMVRRALNHSLSQTSSVECLEHQYISNLDQINTPSALAECVDMDGSTRSIPSLPSDESDPKKNFVINGLVNREFSHSSSGIKAPSSMLHFVASHSYLHSVTDIENINPPSLFNEITDMCNSLADVATSAICSETEVFEDCFTHVADNTLQTENDVTEFSDANSITPIQSDVNSSSSENTPKRQKTLNKRLTSKQRRALAKERYKTYTIAAGMVMKESLMNQEGIPNEETNSYSDNFNTARDATPSICDDTTYGSPTYSVEPKASKLSPKERRLSDRSRYQTQVLEVGHLQNIHQQNFVQNQKECESEAFNISPQQSPSQSPSRSKISVRKNFLERRSTNKERFLTQTLEESKFPQNLPVCDSPPIDVDSDLYSMVEKEANKVLKTLRDTKTNHDELLDCETLSLVSNEDESEHNSGSSVNYRTYHKSWRFKHNIPVIAPLDNLTTTDDPVGNFCEHDSPTSECEEEVNIVPRKPKIVKPGEKRVQDNNNEVEDEQPKSIRGRRKPLYSKSNMNKVTPKSLKPSKNMTSNLVKNVTSTLKSATPTKSSTSKPSKIISKPPVHQVRSNPSSRPVSVSGSPQKSIPSPSNVSLRNSPKHSISRPTSEGKITAPKALERQGTFTKDDSPVTTPQPQVKSRIPGFSSKIPSAAAKSSVSKIPSKQSNIPRSGLFKSASSERSPKANVKVYNRSTSADSRESALSRKIQSSLSSHSLKSEPSKAQQNGAIKKTIQNQRSNSNTSLNGSNTKKQVTSKIASIWRKIEESKKKTTVKNDSKKWIEANIEPETISVSSLDTVVLRNKESDDNAPKRISRLGSFIVMDEEDDSVRLQQVVCGTTNNV